jgi:hypothetical protein
MVRYDLEMQKRNRLAFLGAALAMWRPLWEILGHWSTAEFVLQKLKEVAVLNFLLGTVGGDLMTIIGVSLIVVAFVRVEQKLATFQLSPPFSSSVLPAVSAEIEVQQKHASLRCISAGIMGVSRASGAWKPNGGMPAAAAALKNTGLGQFKDVWGFASYYDSEGRKLAQARVRWLDEPHDNTGFLPGQERTMVVAVQGDGEYFKTPDIGFAEMPDKLKTTKLDVSVSISGKGFSQVILSFNLQTMPNPSFLLAKYEL